MGLDASAVAQFNVLLDSPNIDSVPEPDGREEAVQGQKRPPEPHRPPPASPEEIEAANTAELMSVLAMPRAGQVAGMLGVG